MVRSSVTGFPLELCNLFQPLNPTARTDSLVEPNLERPITSRRPRVTEHLPRGAGLATIRSISSRETRGSRRAVCLYTPTPSTPPLGSSSAACRPAVSPARSIVVRPPALAGLAVNYYDALGLFCIRQGRQQMPSSSRRLFLKPHKR